jgi:hypothetical protein
MNPDDTLRAINDAINADDLGVAKGHADDLLRWVERGGRLPHGWQEGALLKYLRHLLDRTDDA